MDLVHLNREMGKTKVAMMADPELVFFSTVMLSLRTVWDEDHRTAYTNAKVIGWNPKFYLGLDREERVFVMAHEVCHVVYDHMGRRTGKIMKVWQYATDYFINWMLVSRGLKMPKIGLYDDRFAHMSANEIYDVLIAENFDPPDPEWDDLKEPEDDTPEHEAHIQEILLRATTVAKMSSAGPGSVPADILIHMDSLLNPKLPWHTILTRWLTAKVNNGYNWRKPNKRFFPKHHLPSRHSNGLKKIAVFFDASYSVEDFQFHIMVSELAGVLRQFKPDELTVGLFTTKIVSVNRVRSIRELQKIDFRGRGGTCVECVFKWVEENKPDAVLVFTDGDFYWHRDSLDTDLVWVINDNPYFQAKFGKTIHYNTR